jgi:hypothetical protein
MNALKDPLKWADTKAVKDEVDKQFVSRLGPKEAQKKEVKVIE